MAEKPAAEVAIDETLIRHLLAEQAPDLADEPIVFAAEGWDNAVYRIGEAHTLRIPRRDYGAIAAVNEQRWLTELAPRLPLPIPVPVVSGRPGAGYPWPWSIVEWHEGTVLAARAGTEQMADQLAGFLAALHVVASADAPDNPTRGVPLAGMVDRFAEAVDELTGWLPEDEPARLASRLADLRDTPEWSGPPVWMHGDLHPLNLLADGERISAVIDFGDLTSGDPASDLAVAWLAFDGPERRRLQDGLSGVDVATWRRAQAWALGLGAIILPHTDDDPALEAVARAALRRVLDEPAPAQEGV